MCCALPALFVSLGAGATLASLLSVFPKLTWVSEHKTLFLVGAGIMLVVAGILQRRARPAACPPDKKLEEACATARDYSHWIYIASIVVYLVGAGFALLPQLLG